MTQPLGQLEVRPATREKPGSAFGGPPGVLGKVGTAGIIHTEEKKHPSIRGPQKSSSSIGTAGLVHPEEGKPAEHSVSSVSSTIGRYRTPGTGSEAACRGERQRDQNQDSQATGCHHRGLQCRHFYGREQTGARVLPISNAQKMQSAQCCVLRDDCALGGTPT